MNEFNGLNSARKLHVMDQNVATESPELSLSAEPESRNRKILKYPEVCDFKQGLPATIRFRDAVDGAEVATVTSRQMTTSPVGEYGGPVLYRR